MNINWNQPGLSEFDIKDYINDADEMRDYLQTASKNGVDSLLEAMGEIAKSQGMTQLAEKTNLNRASLYKTLSGTINPKIKTVDKIAKAMGFELQMVARHH
jgi:probable addiction module antidote protein